MTEQSAMLARCLRIDLPTGEALGLTEHDSNLTFGGVTYSCDPGMRVSGLVQSSGLAPDHASIETALSGHGPLDTHFKQLSGARAELLRVDAEDLSQQTILAIGSIGEVTEDRGGLVLEFLGLKERLAKPAGRVYQKSCDAVLGDARCGVNLAAGYRFEGTVVSATDGRIDVDVAVVPDAAIFASGTLTVGEESRAIRISEELENGLRLTLWQDFGGVVSAGDTAIISAGCDKSFETCRTRFANGVRFRGFPTIPGVDVLAVTRRNA